MPKRNRGKGLKSNTSQVRGSCPLCSREGIKLLYNQQVAAGEKIQVCKFCRNK